MSRKKYKTNMVSMTYWDKSSVADDLAYLRKELELKDTKIIRQALDYLAKKEKVVKPL